MHPMIVGRLGPPNPKRFASSKGKSREMRTAPLVIPRSRESVPATLDQAQAPLDQARAPLR